ncbi:MAG: ChbG/HpnK family deacetylase, partial [Akkermansiaceae bacterium]|nr:ChbG/HpnK family deacetylase [Armatimonadota bacterium]
SGVREGPARGAGAPRTHGGGGEIVAEGKIRLVVRADDAGSVAEANWGVRQCVEAGTVRNVSLMATGWALSEAAWHLCRETLAPRADVAVGLHVCLNAEWEGCPFRPVLPPDRVPSLVTDAGHFLPMPGDLKARGFSVDEAMAEVAAQCAQLRKSGFVLSYLDEHCGVGWISDELTARLAAFCQSQGLIYATRLLPGLPGEGLDFAARVRQAPTGDYLLVAHPIVGDLSGLSRYLHLRGEPADGSVARERDAERAVLSRPELFQELTDAGAMLVSYPEIFTQ